MTSITATEARKRLYALLDDVANSHEPIQIAGKRNSAVLISEDDWRAVQETLHLTAIPGMRESIRKGLETPVEKCDKELNLVSWTLVYTTQAKRDAKKLSRSGLKPQAQKLLEILEVDPHQTPPPYEKLVGDLTGACSRRINIQHRLACQVMDEIRTVKVIRMWTHYD